MMEVYHYEDGWYVQTVPEPARRRLKSWTAYCSLPSTKRGEYDEEIDVRAMNPAIAKRIVQDALEDGWAPGMKVRRLRFRPEGFMFL